MTLKSSPGEKATDTTSEEEEPRWALVEENLHFLVQCGVRDPEQLAHRLGFASAKTFERYCYRNGIALSYRSQRESGVKIKVFNSRKTDACQKQLPIASSPTEIDRASHCVRRKLGHDIDAVQDVLSMLGLPVEQQFDAYAS